MLVKFNVTWSASCDTSFVGLPSNPCSVKASHPVKPYKAEGTRTRGKRNPDRSKKEGGWFRLERPSIEIVAA